MLSFQSQNYNFPDWRDVLEKTDLGDGKPTYFFKSGLTLTHS